MSDKFLVDVCPLCKGNNLESFESVIDSGEELKYSMCAACGLVFQSPRMGEAELIEFYRSTYRRLVQDSEAPTEKDLRIQAGRARHLMNILSQEIKSANHHLDIGSSSGALLRKVDSHFNCDSIGIEPGDAYRAASRSDGVLTYKHLHDLPHDFRKRFDFVSIIHTLEHMPDPVGYLNELRKEWMTPSAMLLVETPNLFGHFSLELTHLVAFSPKTLRQTLEEAGFDVLKLVVHGEPRSPILRLYTTIVARALPLDAKIQKTQFRAGYVRLQRRLGLWRLKMFTKFLPKWTWRDYPPFENNHNGTNLFTFLTVTSTFALSNFI